MVPILAVVAVGVPMGDEKAMLDLTAAPTNKLLLEVGPEGRVTIDERFDVGACHVEIMDDGTSRFWLELAPSDRVPRKISLKAWSYDDDYYVAIMPMNPISTLGEVVALYELLSQKKWPGHEASLKAAT